MSAVLFDAESLFADGWMPWEGSICPVSACTRVEVLQELRCARGVACAFNWMDEDGPRAVWFWRLERKE